MTEIEAPDGAASDIPNVTRFVFEIVADGYVTKAADVKEESE